MSATTYLAAPAGLIAHRFDDGGMRHRLPIAAWWQKPESVRDKHEGDGPNLHPVVIGEDGALQCDDARECVITGADQAPRPGEMLGRLTERLQRDARSTPAGKVATGKRFGDADRDRLEGATQRGESVAAYLLEGDGARHLATLSRHYDEKGGTIEQTEADPKHPAIDTARAALYEGDWLKE